LPHNLLQTNPCIRHNFSTQVFRKRAASCATFSGLQRSAAQGPQSEVMPRAFWRLVSKICDECKGSFARGCEAKRWLHWTCYSLGTIFQPMRINSVPDVKCFYNNKSVLRAQSMVWHFVRHPVNKVLIIQPNTTTQIINTLLVNIKLDNITQHYYFIRFKIKHCMMLKCIFISQRQYQI